MSEIKRYRITGHGYLVYDEQGNICKYEDVKALESKVSELEKANKELKTAIAKGMTRTCFEAIGSAKTLEARIKELEGGVKDYLRVSEKTGYTMREVANRTILDNLLTDTKEPDNLLDYPECEKEPYEPPTDNWISVSDRLPDDEQRVVCYSEAIESWGESYFHSIGDIFSCYKFSTCQRYIDVTHWQPIAPPINQGESDS